MEKSSLHDFSLLYDFIERYSLTYDLFNEEYKEILKQFGKDFEKISKLLKIRFLNKNSNGYYHIHDLINKPNDYINNFDKYDIILNEEIGIFLEKYYKNSNFERVVSLLLIIQSIIQISLFIKFKDDKEMITKEKTEYIKASAIYLTQGLFKFSEYHTNKENVDFKNFDDNLVMYILQNFKIHTWFTGQDPLSEMANYIEVMNFGVIFNNIIKKLNKEFYINSLLYHFIVFGFIIIFTVFLLMISYK